MEGSACVCARARGGNSNAERLRVRGIEWRGVTEILIEDGDGVRVCVRIDYVKRERVEWARERPRGRFDI